ncbi:MAG: hypothetical protein ACM65M_15050 [Microcoleus sp.]
MQIILEVPDRLGEQLHALGDRLPEALDRALQETHLPRNHLLPRRSPNRRTACESTQPRSHPRHPPHACITNPHERIARSQ